MAQLGIHGVAIDAARAGLRLDRHQLYVFGDDDIAEI
jgi:hypothetical protein